MTTENKYGKSRLMSNNFPPMIGPIMFPMLVNIEFMPPTNPCSFAAILDKYDVTAGRIKSKPMKMNIVTSKIKKYVWTIVIQYARTADTRKLMRVTRISPSHRVSGSNKMI